MTSLSERITVDVAVAVDGEIGEQDGLAAVGGEDDQGAGGRELGNADAERLKAAAGIRDEVDRLGGGQVVAEEENAARDEIRADDVEERPVLVELRQCCRVPGTVFWPTIEVICGSATSAKSCPSQFWPGMTVTKCRSFGGAVTAWAGITSSMTR